MTQTAPTATPLFTQLRDDGAVLPFDFDAIPALGEYVRAHAEEQS